jgi:selenide,water dikinase
VRAATDVTGFGLAGHASGIARESGLTLELRARDLPLLPSAASLALAFPPGGLKSNRGQFAPLVRFGGEVDETVQALVFDPQTSGGLLLLVPGPQAAAVLAELPHARAIGVARPRGEDAIVVS